MKKSKQKNDITMQNPSISRSEDYRVFTPEQFAYPIGSDWTNVPDTRFLFMHTHNFLELAAEMGKTQSDAVFVFDEPTIGLHPQDVGVLLEVFDKLIGNGATVVVIEHDLDVIKNADYIIDMGPRGGVAGGRIVAEGTPEDIKNSAESITGKYL